MTHTTRANFDTATLNAGQGPVGDLLGQFCAPEEAAEVVGQCVQLKSDFIVAEPLAGQSCPVDRVLAFLDVLLCRAALIIEAHDPFGVHRQVGDDEADTGEQLSGGPFDLCDDTAGVVPGRRLIYSTS